MVERGRLSRSNVELAERIHFHVADRMRSLLRLGTAERQNSGSKFWSAFGAFEKTGVNQELAAARPFKHHQPMTRSLTAILIREDAGFVALCPEVDVASQGNTVEEAKRNLQEAVELFFECASKEEIQSRLSTESFVSSLEVAIA